jgi:hypothetical protein
MGIACKLIQIHMMWNYAPPTADKRNYKVSKKHMNIALIRQLKMSGQTLMTTIFFLKETELKWKYFFFIKNTQINLNIHKKEGI